MKRRILSIVCVAAAFASCSQSESDLSGAGAPSLISVSPGIISRATELNFEENDKIGLSVIMSDDTIWFDNQSMIYDGSVFTGGMLWYSDLFATSTLAAYYPYAEGDSAPTTFSVAADQTADGAYTSSDLMIAVASDVTPSSSAVAMTFNHVLSRIDVEVTNETDKAIESVVVGGTYLGATVDVAAASVVVDQTSSKSDITAPLFTDGVYKAMIIPQSTDLTFTITFDDASVEVVSAMYATYAGGKAYYASLTFVGEDILLSISSSEINGWESGSIVVDNTGGDDSVSFEEFDTYFVYDRVSYNFDTFNGVTIMTDNLRYVPAGKSVSSDATDGSGLWYACELTTDAEGTVTAAASDDEELGLLYNFSTAMCDTSFTTENYDQFEGARGICPKGWHIPTYDEWFALAGQALSASDDTTATFFNTEGDAYGVSYSSVVKANEVGFNFQFSGAVISSKYNTTTVKETYTSTTSTPAEKTVGDLSYVGLPAITYYMCSTGRSTTTLWTMMAGFAYNNVDGKFYLLSGAAATGQVVRCVRDSVKE